jgi:N-acetylglucosaminyldiphosphoundecaprenol N-acetyl-beta-D-mannosaminyltransferase
VVAQETSNPQQQGSSEVATPDRANILGVPLVRQDTKNFIDWLLRKAQGSDIGAATFITYLNAHCSNVAGNDAEYAAILQRAEAVYADGQAIVWASGFLGDALPERVNAADFILELLRRGAGENLKIFLLGSAPGVAERAAARFRAEIPALQIVGVRDGFFDDEAQLLADITAAAPDILLVGMGVPLQEKWVAAHLPQLNAHVVWCVGAMFEYYGEARARAPVWMRKAGLEWLFRLVLEPRRMWRRYLVGNVVFVLRVLRARVVGSSR